MSRILHTADWHLGARLVEEERLPEQELFLNWLYEQLTVLRPALLLVTGDIFDSANPSQEALGVYYRFLARLAAARLCRVLILGGNHDSPATLHAPKDILRALDIIVIGSKPSQPADAIVELPDAVICAVPYLREREVRLSQPGESLEEAARAVREGICDYYRQLGTLASARAGGRPLIATGHLTALEAASTEGERPIHFGNLGAVPADCFAGFAYTALGHLHFPQAVGRNDNIRYSGSPLPLSFAEAESAKELRILSVENGCLSHQPLPIPRFRPLLRLDSQLALLEKQLKQTLDRLPESPLTPWLEITLRDTPAQAEKLAKIRDLCQAHSVSVLKILQAGNREDPQTGAKPVRDLADLTPEEVFREKLHRSGISENSPEWGELLESFQSLLNWMRDHPESPAS